MVERLESRVLLAMLDVSVGIGASRSARFVDADGTAVTVDMRGGTATLTFTGEGLAETMDGRDAFVTGTNVALSGVAATSTSGKSRLAIDAKGGDGRTAVGNISCAGAMKSVRGGGVVLTSGLLTEGAVRRVDLLRADNAVVSLGAGAAGTTVRFREGAVNTDLTAGSPLQSLDLGVWGGVQDGGSIMAPSIGNLSAEAFQGEIGVGSAGTINLGDSRDSVVTVTNSLAQLIGTIGTNITVNVGGDLATLSFSFLQHSRIYAGVGPLSGGATMPTSLSDFIADSTIRRASIANGSSSADVVIAARTIHVASAGLVDAFDPATASVVFVADSIRHPTALIQTSSKRGAKRLRLPVLENAVEDVGRAEFRAL